MNNINVRSSYNRRNLLDTSNNFLPMKFSLSNYSTETQSKTMKDTLGETLLLNSINKLHLISDPLRKNLADSVITGATTETMKFEKIEKPPPQRSDSLTALSGITNFFSGVFNVMTAMFQKPARASSPVSQYYDCFDFEDEAQMSPSLAWHPAKSEVQNKNEQTDQIGCNGSTILDTSMTSSRDVVTSCENKINEVRSILKNDCKVSPNYKSRRPRRVFVESGSVEDSFEDAFCPEDMVHLANDTFIECYGAFNHHQQDLFETYAPYIKTDMCVDESMEIVKNLKVDKEVCTEEINLDVDKNKIVTSCEDKINKIKELLKSKCKSKKNDSNETDKSLPIPIKEAISNEITFGNEIGNVSKDSDTTNSIIDNSFDEVKGKFYSSSADSDDSFQIVFADTRNRKPSDCESEDSFIVFEESPDSCYTSHDVFGNDNDSDSDSDLEEDSGYGITTCKLNHSFSRTFGDLTDDSLYSADVVDCAVRVGDEIRDCDVSDEARGGLLLDDDRKLKKKQQPAKKVHFSPHPPKVHVMRVWAFAARQARAGHWERHALDRERFRRRIADVDVAISWVLKPQHRSRVMFQRFMPWWNALKRKELAEKKALEQKIKEESESVKEEMLTVDAQKCNELDEKKDLVQEIKEEESELVKEENTEEILRDEDDKCKSVDDVEKQQSVYVDEDDRKDAHRIEIKIDKNGREEEKTDVFQDNKLLEKDENSAVNDECNAHIKINETYQNGNVEANEIEDADGLRIFNNKETQYNKQGNLKNGFCDGVITENEDSDNELVIKQLKEMSRIEEDDGDVKIEERETDEISKKVVPHEFPDKTEVMDIDNVMVTENINIIYT